MVILEETDPGIFDRGTPTRKLVHQLSSTRDPVFSLRVPASRIIGGYTVKDGVIVPQLQPRRDHRGGLPPHARDRGLMTSAKLLSAVEPVIRYQRGRFRGGESAHARLAALRARPAAEGGRAAPAGGCLGHRRGRRLARLRRGARCSTSSTRSRSEKDEILRRAGHRRRHARSSRRCAVQKEALEFLSSARSPKRSATRRASRRCKPTRWCSSCCSIRWPTCSARPASSGTPATAPT